MEKRQPGIHQSRAVDQLLLVDSGSTDPKPELQHGSHKAEGPCHSDAGQWQRRLVVHAGVIATMGHLSGIWVAAVEQLLAEFAPWVAPLLLPSPLPFLALDGPQISAQAMFCPKLLLVLHFFSLYPWLQPLQEEGEAGEPSRHSFLCPQRSSWLLLGVVVVFVSWSSDPQRLLVKGLPRSTCCLSC